MTPPRFSVVIPTFQRRTVVLRSVAALGRQEHTSFEVIVVDDGSSDGTAAAPRSLQLGFPVTVIEQSNHGAGHARNAGAAIAGGELLLFLDDDMEADSRMLHEHDRSHRAGADLVLGDLPLHRDSPDNLLSRGVRSWARARAERLASSADVPLADLLTGQISIARSVFERLGGFDQDLTRNGLFGGEDIDFGYRIRRAGYKIVFNPSAVSYQFYDVDPAVFLRRVYEAGRAEQELAFKHPERAGDLDSGLQFGSRRSRLLSAPLIAAPEALSHPLRAGVAWLVRHGYDGARVARTFLIVRIVERHRGIRAARRTLTTGQAVVLAYHALEDLHDDPILGEYGISPRRLSAQLRRLRRCGWTFIDLDRLLDALAGTRALPQRAVLITFDDGYQDLLDGVTALRAAGAPAIVFAVAGQVGQTNAWDLPAGAAELRLLDAQELQYLDRSGIEIGSHGVSHRLLSELDARELDEELRGSAERLEGLGLRRPRAISYPHGADGPVVAEGARRHGYSVAFTVTPGVVRRHSPRWALPRVEVLANDTPWRLALKLTVASWPVRTRLLQLVNRRR